MLILMIGLNIIAGCNVMNTLLPCKYSRLYEHTDNCRCLGAGGGGGAQWRSAGQPPPNTSVGGDTSQCVLGNTPGDTN